MAHCFNELSCQIKISSQLFESYKLTSFKLNCRSNHAGKIYESDISSTLVMGCFIAHLFDTGIIAFDSKATAFNATKHKLKIKAHVKLAVLINVIQNARHGNYHFKC